MVPGMSFLTTPLATAIQAAAEPAGGAAIDQIVIATLGAVIATAILGGLGFGHRAGRTQILARIGAFSERVSGLPAWSAVPGAVSGAALLVALVGMYWDISLHIDDGRDAGPLANPAHYLILAGLFGVFAAGFLAIVLSPDGEKPSPGSIRVTRGWYAPLGGVLMVCCSAFSLVGFPLDDMWHRLFGQDVTLWGPTHLMLIGGAGMTLVGMSVLLVEGRSAAERTGLAGSRDSTPPGSKMWDFVMKMRFLGIAGGFLVGLSTFQAEFDFGVPQFAQILQPALIAVAAGVALVSARVFLGRWAALGAVAHFLAIRGLVTVFVGPVMGETTPHFPLYIAEALLVEAVAFAVVVRANPVRFGAIAGAAIGTVGVLAEHGWSQVWMPLPWSADMLPQALAVGLVSGVAAGALGGWVGAMLRAPADVAAGEPTPGILAAGAPWLRRLAVPGACAVVLAAVVGYGLDTTAPAGVRADVRLSDVATGAARTVNADIRITPASAADDARWLNITAWQGGAKLHVDRLERLGPGHYRTTKPVPVTGEWKAMLRLHDADGLAVMPIFLPLDAAIPAPEVPATAVIARPFQGEQQVLQREAKEDVPGGLKGAGYAIVLAIAGALLFALAWGLDRLAAPAAAGPGGGTWRRTRPRVPSVGAAGSA